jgi:hypothetical protein
VALYALFDRRPAASRAARAAAALVALACIVFYFTPLVRMGVAYVHRNGQFPVLADFRSRIEQSWVVGYGVNREIADGALQVEFLAAQWPGVSLHEPMPDWRAFKVLVIDVENPDAERLPLSVRVHDRRHGRTYNDRFNRRFDMGPRERRTLRISLEDIRRGPRQRLMDMGHISDITLFRDQPRGSRHLRIYSVRLE